MLATLAAGAVLGAAPLAAQGATETAGFLWRLGTDTTDVERFTRAPGRLEGAHLTRVPQTTLREWSADVAPDGSVRRFEQTLRRDGIVLSRRVITFAGDSARDVFTRGDSTTTRTIAVPPGTVLDLPNSYAFYELALRRGAGRASLSAPLLAPGARAVESATFTRAGGDTMIVQLEGLPPITARVDRGGRILWANNLGTIVERVAAPDVHALATAFGPRPLGVLSPRDTVRAVIAGANVAVDYSRPARRGRVVFGGLVPWDVVWRTGANRTTTLITDADLAIGGVTVPAGRYALFTIPTPSGWTLIINRNVGSGLEYSPEADLARVPVPVATAPERIERFTIAIEPRDDGGMLSFAWEHTRAAIAFRRK
ncbi:MAG: DUF2911 domain-containing protein [Gemmatimonadales bacterium]